VTDCFLQVLPAASSGAAFLPFVLIPGAVVQSVVSLPERFSVWLLAMSNTTPADYPILAVPGISPLRQRMIDDMTVGDLAPSGPNRSSLGDILNDPIRPRAQPFESGVHYTHPPF
jgi:hypothetical protein